MLLLDCTSKNVCARNLTHDAIVVRVVVLFGRCKRQSRSIEVAFDDLGTVLTIDGLSQEMIVKSKAA